MPEKPESNKIIVRKWIDAWVNGDLEVLDKLFTQDYTVNGVLIGIDGVKQAVEFLHTVLADVSAELNEMVAEDDRVVIRWTVCGRHVGHFMGVPPTGQLLTLRGINIYNLTDEKINSNHEQTNILEVLQSIQAGK